MEQLREQCINIYESWRMTEAAEKKRREAQDRAEKEAGNAVTFGRQVPQGVSSGVRAAMGVPGGAWPLSEALTRGGTAGVNGIQQRALNQLMAGMGGVSIDQPDGKGRHSATYPRRSQSQLDRALSVLDEPQRVEAMGNDLPFGGHSVVAGAYANIVTQLVEAQAEGHIDTPLASIGIAVATWVAWEAGQAEIEMKDEQRERLQAAVQALLPQQKRVARETLAILEPPTPPEPGPVLPNDPHNAEEGPTSDEILKGRYKKTAPDLPLIAPINRDPRSCVVISQERESRFSPNYTLRFRNHCSFWVRVAPVCGAINAITMEPEINSEQIRILDNRPCHEIYGAFSYEPAPSWWSPK